MTVLMKQVKPDPETLERQSYSYRDVWKVEIYRLENGCYMIRLEFENGGGAHYPLDGWGYEIQQSTEDFDI